MNDQLDTLETPLYYVKREMGSGWRTVSRWDRAPHFTDFDEAYRFMETQARRNIGVAFHISSARRVIGAPLMYSKQDLSQVVAHERAEKVKR